MAIKFSDIKRALRKHALVGFKSSDEGSGPEPSRSKINTSKRGDMKAEDASDVEWNRTAASKRGVIKNGR
jgi:hypothetical protein